MLGLPEKKIKQLGSRERVKLDSILKKLFDASPAMVLGTIDDLYSTSYRNQYINGQLTDEDIVFLSTDFIRDTFRYEVLRADIVIKIKDYYYQIELQTSYDNMTIRFARYGLEIGIRFHERDPETGIIKIPIPEQSVIYLENNKTNNFPNHYELWWQNKKVATIEVRELKLWELEMQDIFQRKLYNLLPLLIFSYRLKLIEVGDNVEELDKLKNSFLEDARGILKKTKLLDNEIKDTDIDIIISVVGELITYFDNVFFNGTIKREGEFDMVWTEQVQDWRRQINNAKSEVSKAEAKGISKGMAEGISKGELRGKVELLYTKFEYTAEGIAKKLNMSLEAVEEILEDLDI